MLKQKIFLLTAIASLFSQTIAMEKDLYLSDQDKKHQLAPAASKKTDDEPTKNNDDLWTGILDPVGDRVVKCFTLQELMQTFAPINKASYRKVTGHAVTDTDLSIPSDNNCLLKLFSAHYLDTHTNTATDLITDHRRANFAPILNSLAIRVEMITYRPYSESIVPCWLWSLLDQNLTRPHSSWWRYIPGTNIFFVNASHQEPAPWADTPGYILDDEAAQELAKCLKKSNSVKHVFLGNQPIREQTIETIRADFPQIEWKI